MTAHPQREAILRRLAQVCLELGPLVNDVLLVGGSAPATFEMDIGDVRGTTDVDLVIRASYAGWSAFQNELSQRGFSHKIDSHVSKMVKGDLELDIVPDDEPSLRSNRWYKAAYDDRVFDSRTGLHVIRPIYFLATKLEAYRAPDRMGAGRPIESHDIEDVVVTLAGMPSLRRELEVGRSAAHGFVRYELGVQIVNHPDALLILQSHLPVDEASQSTSEALLRWLQTLADIADS